MREPELLKAFGAGWATVTDAGALLPGGLHETRADADNVPAEKQGEDYGVITVTENGIARNTNGGPIREHLVKIELHTIRGLSSLGAAQNAMADRSAGLPSKLPPHTALDNGGYIIDLFSAPSAVGGQTSSRRKGKTVSKLSVVWRVQSRWPS